MNFPTIKSCRKSGTRCARIRKPASNNFAKDWPHDSERMKVARRPSPDVTDLQGALSPRNSRFAPGPGLIGFDGGTKRAAAMVALPPPSPVYYEDITCGGYDCTNPFKITLADLAICSVYSGACQDPFVITLDGGMSGEFDIPPLPNPADNSCGWFSGAADPPVPVGTITIFFSGGGSADVDMYASIGCSDGTLGIGIAGPLGRPFENLIAFLGTFDGTGVAANFLTTCGDIGCPDIAIFINGTVTIG